MPRFIIFNFGEGAFAWRVFGVPFVPAGFCALAPNVTLAIYVGLHLAVGLHSEGAMPRFIIFNFGEGAFARQVLRAPLVPPGFCALAPNVTLAIYLGLPARKQG